VTDAKLQLKLLLKKCEINKIKKIKNVPALCTESKNYIHEINVTRCRDSRSANSMETIKGGIIIESTG